MEMEARSLYETVDAISLHRFIPRKGLSRIWRRNDWFLKEPQVEKMISSQTIEVRLSDPSAADAVTTFLGT
jgi:hypothetical protein